MKESIVPFSLVARIWWTPICYELIEKEIKKADFGNWHMSNSISRVLNIYIYTAPEVKVEIYKWSSNNIRIMKQ